MNPLSRIPPALGVVLLAAVCLTAVGFVNPNMQPGHIANQCRATLGLRVTAIDMAAKRVTCAVETVLVGESALRTLHIDCTAGEAVEAFFALAEGATLVAYAGMKGPPVVRNNVLIYLGGGLWHRATMDAGDAGEWRMGPNADSEAVAVMFGTFNGRVERLTEMMRDHGLGRGYFPAIPVARFSETILADGALSGGSRVGLIDLDGDGDLDVLATSDGQAIAAYNDGGTLSRGPLPAGLEPAGATSLAVADADGDGDQDVLAGKTLFRFTDGAYRPSPLVGIDATHGLLQSTFADIDADGDQDVVVSYAGAGFAILANDGTGGFAAPVAVVGEGTGHVDLTDWDLDGRLDLVYSAGGGTIHQQRADGRGSDPIPLVPAPDDHLSVAGQALGALGCATLWDQGSYAALLPWENGCMLLRRADAGAPEDVTGATNELQEPSTGLAQVLLADLSADGLVDVYAAGRAAGSPTMYWENRGYGSFIQAEKYAAGSIPATTCATGATGIAAGDLDGDGDEDVLVARADGRLVLLRNLTIDNRLAGAETANTADELRRIAARTIRVVVPGASGRGAQVSLARADGAIVARRTVGAGAGTGNATAQLCTITIRDPGAYVLRVQRTDGSAWTHAVDQAALPLRPEPIVVP